MLASQIVLTRATRFSNPARSRPRTKPTAPMTSAASMTEMLNPRKEVVHAAHRPHDIELIVGHQAQQLPLGIIRRNPAC